MLKRIITALVLIPLVLIGIFKLNQQHFAICAALLCLVGAWEWAQFCNMKKVLHRICYALTFLLPFYGGWSYKNNNAFVFALLIISVLFWMCAIAWMYLYSNHGHKIDLSDMAKLSIGYLVLTPMWLALFSIQGQSSEMVLWLLLMVWGADSGAYFIGRKFGRKKLAAKLSPKKTIEGAYGGFVASAIVAVVGVFILKLDIGNMPYWVVVATLVVISSIVGDLFESMLKRLVGIKDSGFIFPGHGGVLDRIDSLTTAAPVFFLGTLILNSLRA
ncbi:MAG: phosphatidate cytidylyltransferase [Gammaproteobacteria bacterium]|nr:MAG: phosphatidate cytidylyltransferase [Gammaproteobacteria bacterium]